MSEKARIGNCRRAERYRMRHPERLKNYRQTHKESLRLRAKKYRETYKDKIKEYRKTHREQIYANAKKWRTANPEKVMLRVEAYRAKNRDKLREYFRVVNIKRRPENRQCVLGTVLNGKQIIIRGLLKRPYPIPQQCELCGQPFLRLKYHHWMDTKFMLASPRSKANPLYVAGIWVCQPCDLFCHKLMDYPLLPKKWEILKAEAEAYITKLSSQLKGRIMGE